MPVITLANPVRPPSETCYAAESGKPIKAPNYANIKRVVPAKELRASKWFKECAVLGKIFNHDVVEVDDGPDEDGKPHSTWRWRPNLLVAWIHDHAGIYTPSNLEADADGIRMWGTKQREGRASLSANILVMDLHNGMFTMEEWMKYQMQIGYSLSGFYELFGQHEAAEYELPGAKDPVSDGYYTETVIDYMIRVHKGKVLRL